MPRAGVLRRLERLLEGRRGEELYFVPGGSRDSSHPSHMSWHPHGDYRSILSQHGLYIATIVAALKQAVWSLRACTNGGSGAHVCVGGRPFDAHVHNPAAGTIGAPPQREAPSERDAYSAREAPFRA
jgi:hypothetical protein